MENKANILMPPNEVFFNKNEEHLQNPIKKVIREFKMFQFDHMEYPEFGGQLAYFKECPFPQKGHPYPTAIYAINEAKRFLRGMFRVFASKSMVLPLLGFFLSSKKKKIDILSRFCQAYVDFSSSFLEDHRLEFIRYGNFTRELINLVARFLYFLGIEKNLAEQFAEFFCIILEYDDAYRLRIEDLLSVTSLEKIIKIPIHEIKKLAEIMVLREPGHRKDIGNGEKFVNVSRILSIILLLPSFRKAFKESLIECKFENLQYDDADRYHVMWRNDYDYMGYSIEDRIKMLEVWHNFFPPVPPRIIIKAQ